MAISAVHYRLMCEHRELLPRGGDVLQIGDANWYGDVDPSAILELDDDRTTQRLVQGAIDSGDNFNIAKAFYRALFHPQHIDSVDINGNDGCLRLDLNKPLRLSRQYDLSVNHGTAEHVFHIAQVFGTVHAWTKPGGLMIHEAPWLGWPDHGFYSLHPTLFYDLAAANGYDVVSVTVATNEEVLVRVGSREHLVQWLPISRASWSVMSLMLFVVLRKGAQESEFKLPMQGVYDGRLSAEGKLAWETVR